MYRINVRAGKSAGQSYYVRNDKAVKSVYHSRPVPIKIKRNRRQAISFDTRITGFRQLIKTLVKVWHYGIRITFILAMLACGLQIGINNAPKEAEAQAVVVETPEKIEKVAPVVETKIDYFTKYFGQDAKIAKAICKAENTKEDPAAYYRNKNGSVDQGLCQINTINVNYYAGENIFDPEVNIKTAKKVYDSQGWFAWTQYKNGSYLKFIEIN